MTTNCWMSVSHNWSWPRPRFSKR